MGAGRLPPRLWPLWLVAGGWARSGSHPGCQHCGLCCQGRPAGVRLRALGPSRSALPSGLCLQQAKSSRCVGKGSTSKSMGQRPSPMATFSPPSLHSQVTPLLHNCPFGRVTPPLAQLLRNTGVTPHSSVFLSPPHPTNRSSRPDQHLCSGDLSPDRARGPAVSIPAPALLPAVPSASSQPQRPSRLPSVCPALPLTVTC